jgi:hypothetical protein
MEIAGADDMAEARRVSDWAGANQLMARSLLQILCNCGELLKRSF